MAQGRRRTADGQRSSSKIVAEGNLISTTRFGDGIDGSLWKAKGNRDGCYEHMVSSKESRWHGYAVLLASISATKMRRGPFSCLNTDQLMHHRTTVAFHSVYCLAGAGGNRLRRILLAPSCCLNCLVVQQAQQSPHALFRAALRSRRLALRMQTCRRTETG